MSGAARLERPPVNASEWTKEAQRFRVHTLNINDMDPLRSGSQVTEGQFLAERVLWPKIKGTTKVPAHHAYDKKAATILKNMRPFQEYLQHIRDGKKTVSDLKHGDENLGAFQGVRDSQLQIAEEKSKEPPTPNVQLRPRLTRDDGVARPRITESPEDSQGLTDGSQTSRSATRSFATSTHATQASDETWVNWEKNVDEQDINSALIEYLGALTRNIDETRCRWFITRLVLQAEFGHATMEARTDGYLGLPIKDDKSREAFAIVETKSGTRSRDEGLATYMQESSEMILWILRDKKVGRKVQFKERLLVSQDRHEIYVTFASPSDDYVKYLLGEYTGAGRKFMTMQEYGPFNIKSASAMERLAKTIVSFCLRVNDSIKKWETSQESQSSEESQST